MKKLIDISLILDLTNYLSSLQRWIQLYNHKLDPILQQQYFNQYIKVVKPVIHKYHNVVTKLDGDSYAFSSGLLSYRQILALREVYPQLVKFQIFGKEEMDHLESNNKYERLSLADFQLLAGKPVTEINRLSLNQIPKNAQFKYWKSYISVDNKQFKSMVIHGKGIARKQLGFPTANLKVTQQIQSELRDYPNGIYLVEFTFLQGLSYYGVSCIGSNPHYQNLKNHRVIEVYLLHDFGQKQFYDAKVGLKILLLMRFQGKFLSFDAFLNAMHNDIFTGMELAKQFKQLAN